MNINADFHVFVENGRTYVRVKFNQDGFEKGKVITYEDFLTLINGSSVSGVSQVFGPFPSGTVFYTDLPNGFSISVDIKKHRRIMVLDKKLGEKKEAYEVCYPRLLLTGTAEKGRLKGMGCYALKGDEPVTMNTPLYRYPYSNVYDNGRVCRGGNDANGITSPDDLWSAMERIMFLSMSNGDLFRTCDGNDFPDFVKKMSSIPEFPQELLVDMGITVSEIINY